MNVSTIVLEQIGAGKPSLTIVTGQDNEEAARAYAAAAIAQSPDLRVWRFMPDPGIQRMRPRGVTGRLG